MKSKVKNHNLFGNSLTIMGRHLFGFNYHWKIFKRHGILEIERILEAKYYTN